MHNQFLYWNVHSFNFLASHNNYYGNIVYSILNGRVSELIKKITMSDKCWSKGNNYRRNCAHYRALLCFELRWLYTMTNQLKYRLHLCTTGNIALGHGLEADIALGFTSCYISLSITPSCYISPYCTHHKLISNYIYIYIYIVLIVRDLHIKTT